MRQTISRLLLATLLLCGAVAVPATQSGCAIFNPEPRLTDEDRVSDMEGTYNLAMEVIFYASVQGWIPDDQLDRIEEIRAGADAAITSLKLEVASGTPLDRSTYMRAATEALREMSRIQLQYQAKVQEHKGQE